MKYYRLFGTVDKIEDMYWTHLIKGEPTLEILTKEEYEDYRGIKPQRASVVHDKSPAEYVVEAPAKEVSAQVSGENTKKEIIAEIIKRGSETPESRLKMKNKTQLLEML